MFHLPVPSLSTLTAKALKKMGSWRMIRQFQMRSPTNALKQKCIFHWVWCTIVSFFCLLTFFLAVLAPSLLTYPHNSHSLYSPSLVQFHSHTLFRTGWVSYCTHTYTYTKACYGFWRILKLFSSLKPLGMLRKLSIVQSWDDAKHFHPHMPSVTPEALTNHFSSSLFFSPFPINSFAAITASHLSW